MRAFVEILFGVKCYRCYQENVGSTRLVTTVFYCDIKYVSSDNVNKRITVEFKKVQKKPTAEIIMA